MDEIDYVRQDFRKAVFDAFNRGEENAGRNRLTREFSGKRVSRATLFRWHASFSHEANGNRPLKSKMAAAKKSLEFGGIGKTIDESGAPAASSRPRRRPRPLISVEVGTRPRRIVETGIDFMEGLRVVLNEAQDMLGHARDDTGRVRNVGLILKSIELISRTLARAVRIQESLNDQAELDLFCQALKQTFYKVSPEVRQILAAELHTVGSQYADDFDQR